MRYARSLLTEVDRWSSLPDSHRYLWEHLGAHLVGAELYREWAGTMADPQRVGTKIAVSGAAALENDLGRAERARRWLDDGEAADTAQNVSTWRRELHLVDRAISVVGPPLSVRSGVLTAEAAFDGRRPAAWTGAFRRTEGHDPRLAGPIREHLDGVGAVAWAPDGQRVATGSLDCFIRIWDLESGQLIGQPWRAHSANIASVGWSTVGVGQL